MKKRQLAALSLAAMMAAGALAGCGGGQDAGTTEAPKAEETTAEGKKLFLEPKKIGFDIESAGNEITLDDEKSVSLKSGSSLNISAVEGIGLYAKKVIIRAPGALNILRDPEN